MCTPTSYALSRRIQFARTLLANLHMWYVGRQWSMVPKAIKSLTDAENEVCSSILAIACVLLRLAVVPPASSIAELSSNVDTVQFLPLPWYYCARSKSIVLPQLAAFAAH